ncbi:hypothetical protein BC828DRAFT_404720 [Blastocladiella britannica]|nr:hypothetical protein BC828DRAFT_404720 [Blastocladiella britannica]
MDIPASDEITVSMPQYETGQYAALVRDHYRVNPDWTIAQRYFVPHAFIHRTVTGEITGQDLLVMQSPNCLCMVGIAPTHPVHAHLVAHPGTTVARIEYTDLALSNVQRKARPPKNTYKRRRPRSTTPTTVAAAEGDDDSASTTTTEPAKVNPNHTEYRFFPHTSIATLHVSDGTQFDLCAGVHGTLMQLNDVVLGADPGAAMVRPAGHGFIAIINPTGPKLEPPNYLPIEQYFAEHTPVDGQWPQLVGFADKEDDEEAA